MCRQPGRRSSVLLLLYVDDILLSGSDSEQVSGVIEKPKDRFETVDLGNAKFLLDIGIHRNVNAGTIIFSQETYARTTLETYGMANAHPTKTPAEQGPVQTKEGEALSTKDTTVFRFATGSPLYLGRCTRPNPAHAVMVLTRSMSKPCPRAMTKMKRVLRHLKGRISTGLTYSKYTENGDEVTAYVDADHGGDMHKGHATTGAGVSLAGAPVDWKSMKQTVVAVSTVESGYLVLSKACLRILHIWHLFKTKTSEQTRATMVFEDNKRAIRASRPDRIKSRTKHIDVKFRHVRSLVAANVVDVKYTKTGFQKADIPTKKLGRAIVYINPPHAAR